MERGMMRLLWVDDEAPSRYDYEREELEERGWQVTWAAEVPLAARLLSTQSYNAVLVDQQMGGMQPNAVFAGYRLLCWIRNQKPAFPFVEPGWNMLDILRVLATNQAVPVAFLSSFVTDEMKRLDHQANLLPGLNTFSKPVKLEELYRYVDDIKKRS
jgi:CheY-like chemotaxis protein